MQPITSNKLREILNINENINQTTITNVSTDSRNVDENTLFIALKGEKFDGHDFIEDVIKKGCPLVVVNKENKNIPQNKQIVVDDTLKALGKIAHYNRTLYKGTLIALTGSSGKTTTKELLKQALSVYAKTYATTGNFNNHIGVPRSLLDIDMDSKYAVIEMGMSNLHEIEYLTSLATPDIAIVTNVYPMHIEFLKTLENIALAKSEIFQGLQNKKIAIYNRDTSCTQILETNAQKHANIVLTYGFDDEILSSLNLDDNTPHYQSNALCVLKTLEALGLDNKLAIPTINNFSAPEGRGKKHQLTINNLHIQMIDDSYSGQPDAMKLAIKSLGQMQTKGRKIALIGKMAELGDYSIKAHQEVGQTLKQENIDIVIGVCKETKDMLKELPSSTTQYYFDNIQNVADFLINELFKDNDTILIKGAHYSSKVYEVANTLKKYQ